LYDNTEYTTQSNLDIIKDYHYEEDALYRLGYIMLTIDTLEIEQNFNYYRDENGDTTRITSIIYDIDNDGQDYKYAYTYDELGNITTESYYEGTSLKLYRNYEYDDLNQLIVEDSRDYNESIGTLTDTNFTKYYYDSRGNRTDIKTFLYGQNDYQNYTIPSFYENSTGSTNVKVYYNGIYDCNDIYELELGENPLINISLYNLDSGTWITGIIIVSETYSTLNINEEGYYYSYFVASSKLSVYTEFRIVFKVGNPVNGEVAPQEHIHYNYSSTWEDQLLSFGEIEYINGIPQTEATIQEYTYDSQGNPTEITNFVYNGVTYDYATLAWSGRELTNTYIMSSSGYPIYRIEYTYNDQGYRIQKEFSTFNGSGFTINQTIDYELIDDKVIFETNGTYGILYTYDYDGTLISFNYDSDISDQNSGSEYFYIRNQMGDITHIATSDGTVVVHYVYDAYGKIVDIDSEPGYSKLAEINPYRYRGYRYDSSTNWYYLNSRYYNPEVGRFINADKVLGQLTNYMSTNMYSYSSNNPVNYTDEDGDFWHLLGGFVVGAAIGATAKIVSNIISGEKWSDGVATAAIVGGVTGLMTAAGAGSLAIGLVAGIGTATGNQIEDCVFKGEEFDLKEYVFDAVVTGVLAGVGSSYGSNKIGASAKQIKNWFKPGSFRTMVTGNFMKKITKAVAYSIIPAMDFSLVMSLESDQADSGKIELE
jgi:RHS repeat-associated protein